MWDNKTVMVQKIQKNLLFSKITSISLGLILALFLIFASLLPATYAAGSAELSLDPSGGSYNINDNLKIGIYTNSTEANNAVQADLNYDQSKLQFISIDSSSSAYDLGASSTGGGGTVKIARAKSGGGLTGSKLVSFVNFKAISGSGTTAVTFASSSAVVRQSDAENIWNQDTTGGTYTLTTPNTTAPPTTPPSTTSPSQTSPTNSNTSTSSNGNSSQSGDSSSETANDTETQTPKIGYLVAIKIIDSEGRLVANKVVTINNETITTTDTGTASLSNIPAGTYDVYEGTSTKGKVLASITVVDNPDNPLAVQEFEVTLKPRNKLLVYAIPIAKILGIVLLVLALRSWLKKLRNKRKEFNRHFPKPPKGQKNVTQQVTMPSQEQIKPNQPTLPVQQNQTIQPGQTIAPKQVGLGNVKNPIVWSGDDKK